MNRCEQAVGYHKKGFNCCQSVLATFQDCIGLTEAQCMTLGGGFGMGAGTGELCGAITGGVMVLDLLTPADPSDVLGSKKRSVGQAKELQKRFAERFENLRCADLLQKKFVPDDTTPAAKALGLTGHCDIMIATAVELVEQMLTLARAGKLDGYLLEGMACPGGCVAGAGTVVSADTAAKKLAQHMAQASGETAKDSKYRDLADQLN